MCHSGLASLQGRDPSFTEEETEAQRGAALAWRPCLRDEAGLGSHAASVSHWKENVAAIIRLLPPTHADTGPTCPRDLLPRAAAPL